MGGRKKLVRAADVPLTPLQEAMKSGGIEAVRQRIAAGDNCNGGLGARWCLILLVCLADLV
jgi:hypothetical protein